MWKSQGLIKKEWNFQGDQETLMSNFHGSWSLVLHFPRGVAQFGRISRDEALFCLESSTVKWQTENFRDFYQKIMSSTPPVWEYSGIAQCRLGKLSLVRINDLNLINHYIVYKKNMTSDKYLVFTKFVSFNRHHRCDYKVGD